MRAWAENKLKISGELLSVLYRNRYAEIDKSTGAHVIYLTNLQRNETIQSIAAWFMDKKVADLLLGELRQQLSSNGLAPLRDHSDTNEDSMRAYGFKEFGKKVTA